jgi:hypothetical protein
MIRPTLEAVWGPEPIENEADAHEHRGAMDSLRL